LHLRRASAFCAALNANGAIGIGTTVVVVVVVVFGVVVVFFFFFFFARSLSVEQSAVSIASILESSVLSITREAGCAIQRDSARLGNDLCRDLCRRYS